MDNYKFMILSNLIFQRMFHVHVVSVPHPPFTPRDPSHHHFKYVRCQGTTHGLVIVFLITFSQIFSSVYHYAFICLPLGFHLFDIMFSSVYHYVFVCLTLGFHLFKIKFLFLYHQDFICLSFFFSSVYHLIFIC